MFEQLQNILLFVFKNLPVENPYTSMTIYIFSATFCDGHWEQSYLKLDCKKMYPLIHFFLAKRELLCLESDHLHFSEDQKIQSSCSVFGSAVCSSADCSHSAVCPHPYKQHKLHRRQR